MKAIAKIVGMLLVLVVVLAFNFEYNKGDQIISWMKGNAELRGEFGEIRYARIARVTKVQSAVDMKGVRREGYTRYIIHVNGELASGTVNIRQIDSGLIEVRSIEK